jgi:hypothetical protein
MKITLSTTATDFKYVLEKYYIYKPTFVEAKPDGDIAFTLDFAHFDFETIYKIIFLIGQDCMLQQCKKTLNYETTNQDNSVYSFLEKE